MRIISVWLSIVAVAATCGTAFAQDTVLVTVDQAVVYQTIEGMGACGVTGWKTRSGPFYVDVPFERIADTMVNVVGMTMLRGWDTRSCAFNPTPGQYVITAEMRAELVRVAQLFRAATAAGEPLRFAPNVFSPPGWMKQSGLCDGGGESVYAGNPSNSLLPEHYSAFAGMCSAYVRIVADSFSLPVYAFSPQNEPNFNEPYASCSYSDGSHYARMLAVVGPSVKRASPSVLIYGAEHMAWAYPSWENAIMNNAAANQYLDRFAVHGFVDGVRVDTLTFDSLPDTHARPLWLSEFHWGLTTYPVAFALAHALIKGLVLGSMSVHMAGGGLWDVNGNKYPGYYLNAQFCRFVRPGMQRVKVTSDDDSLTAGAFRNPHAGSVSILLFNTASSDRLVSLSGMGGALPDSFEMRTTSATRSFADDGTVARNAAVLVPAQGMVSLGYGHRATLSGARTTPTRVVRVHQASMVTCRAFDMRGRLLARGATGAGLRVMAGSGGTTVVASRLVRNARVSRAVE